MWRNESELHDVCDALRRHPRLAPWAIVLSGWVDNVNSHSDGWPYWKAGSSAADKLSDMLARAAGKQYLDPSNPREYQRDRPGTYEPTDAELRKALAPMKSCATRHNMPQPEMPNLVAEARVASLQRQLAVVVREANAARAAAAAIAAAAKPGKAQLSLFDDAA